jgi:hypothetical protein
MADLKSLFNKPPAVPVVNTSAPAVPTKTENAPQTGSLVPEPGGQEVNKNELPEDAVGPFIGMFQSSSQANSWNVVEIYTAGDKVIRRELRNPLDGASKQAPMSRAAAFNVLRVLAVEYFHFGGQRKVKDLIKPSDTTPEGKK